MKARPLPPAARLLWQISAPRNLAEGWLVCLVILLALLPGLAGAPPLARSLFCAMLPMIGAAIAGLRLKPLSDRPALVILKEILLAVALSLALTGMLLGALAAAGRLDVVQESFGGMKWIWLFLGLAVPEYLAVRAASWAWFRWDRLRRRRFVWALTHANLGVLGAFAGLALLGGVIYLSQLQWIEITGIPHESAFGWTVFWISSFLFFAAVLAAAGLLAFLPPALLISFLVSRRITRRLDHLAQGTRALRNGDLAARIEVEGEDEIAQLQADFNGMAAGLETATRALQAEKDKVSSLLETQRELVAGVSHELRNPAATIAGYGEALRRGWREQPPEAVDHDLDVVAHEAARLQTILNDLLAIALAEAGRLSLDLQPVDVAALARRAKDTFATLAWEGKRVQVSARAPEQACLACADPVRLEQVLVNLVQNAVRHTSPGGLVAIEVSETAEEIIVEIEDTGEGIPAEDLPHVWEKYYQSGDPRRRAAGGAGLGLALVKELTEAMGGSAAVESWPGQGSLFRIRLPRSA